MKKLSIALIGALTTLFVLGAGFGSPAAGMQQVTGSVPTQIKDLGLQPVGSLPATQRLNLAIGLPVRDPDGLKKFVADVSDPASPTYRQYLTAQQFIDTYSPTDQDYQALTAFAQSHGLTVTASFPHHEVLSVSGTVADIQNAFHVQLLTYNHPTEGRTFYAPNVEPTLDINVRVQDISGLNNYQLPRPMLRPMPSSSLHQPALGSGPGGSYMGQDFRNAYVPGEANLGNGQTVGLLEFDSGFYQSDITAYENLAHEPNVPVTAVLLDGYGGGGGIANDEVSLDIEMAISMAPGEDQCVVFEGDQTNSILGAIVARPSISQIGASWTYGINNTSEQLWQQMGAQGQSFYNASGDGDAYVGTIDTPADDPYLQVVGGTTLSMTSGGGAYISETVWNWGNEYGQDGVGTGGGISTRYNIPSWQQGVSMATNQGSTTKRNTPDIGMTADNVYVIYNHGNSGAFGGTSCATPLWAAYTALVNEQAVAESKPLMGFINPTIYSIGTSGRQSCYFHDTVTGDNTWRRSPSKYYGVSGYDLCVGFGCPTSFLLQALLGNYTNPNCQSNGGVGAVAQGPARQIAVPMVLPNPSHGPCNVAFDCLAAGRVTVTVLDMNGRVVRHLMEGNLTAGNHTVAWDGLDASGRNLAAGVYFARVTAAHGVNTAKLVLAR